MAEDNSYTCEDTVLFTAQAGTEKKRREGGEEREIVNKALSVLCL